MKNLIKIAGVAVVMWAGLGSCKKEVNSIEPSQQEVKSVDADAFAMPLTRAAWVIADYKVNGAADETFAGYEFKFSNTGIVYAIDRDGVVKGKWRRDRQVLYIDFGMQKPVYQLNNPKWVIVERAPGVFTIKGISQFDNASRTVVFKRKG